jgi:hypothetical protein
MAEFEGWKRCDQPKADSRKSLVCIAQVDSGWMIPQTFSTKDYKKNEESDDYTMTLDGRAIMHKMGIACGNMRLGIQPSRLVHFNSNDGDSQSYFIWKIDQKPSKLTVGDTTLLPMFYVEDRVVIGWWDKNGSFYYNDGFLDAEGLMSEELFWVLDNLV